METKEETLQPVLLVRVTQSTTPLFDEVEMDTRCSKEDNETNDKAKDTESTESTTVQIDDSREQWGRKTDFLLSCIGYAVGLGNIWRFPYLCYANGGATFLIPYFLALIFNGIPLFYMELAIGQYLSLGTIGVWTAICPMARGIGFAMIMISFLVSIYYNVVIAWCLLFLWNSFSADVPWKTCDNDWNTDLCRTERYGNMSINCTALGMATNCTPAFNSPTSEFFNNKILHISDSINNLGEIHWELVVSLLVAWLMVFFCLMKGVKSSGKVVYFTATFPYIILIILFFRGVTLDGALDGVLFYVKPNLEKLADPQVWVRAATQIFYSLGVGFGSLMTFGSYNKFHNNCQGDALLVTIINCGTSFFAGFVIFSVMGFMAFNLGTSVDKVAATGPGLTFIAYPEAISQMPVSTLWAILFFFMLLTLGLDSQFAMVECVITGLTDEYPKHLKKAKWFILIFMCCLMFALAIPMCTDGGMYVFNLFDYQTGGISLLIIGFSEVMFIGWGVGTERLCTMIENMIGKKPNYYFIVCWKYISPVFCLFIIISQLVLWGGVSYNGQAYPTWAEFIGWVLAFMSMSFIPIFAVIQFYKAKGATFKEKWRNALSPDAKIFREVEERQGISPRDERIA